MGSRLAGIDAVRIVGIAAVVAGHVWWQSDVVRSLIYTWHVPVFFFLTGYFWKRKRPFSVEVFARSRALLVPYATWLILISLFFVPWLLITGRDAGLRTIVDIVIGGAHIGRPYSAFWFITALFFATTLLRLVQRFPLWVPATASAAAVVATYLAPHPIAALPLSAGTAVPAIAFVLCGYLAQRTRASITRPLLLSAGLLVVSAAAIAVGSGGLDLKQADFGPPIIGFAVAVAIAWGLVLIATTLEVRIPDVVGAQITAIAVSGTGVILAHAAVLQLLGTPDDGHVADFLIALILPWAVGYLMAWTPLAPALLGAPRRARAVGRTRAIGA